MLLVHARRDPRSRFSGYLAEILAMEGFGEVAAVDIDDLDDGALANAGLIVLPRVSLTAQEASRLVDFVAQGGKLLALHPDPYLGNRFGLRPAQRATAVGAGHLWIDADEPATAGLCTEAVQIVAPAVVWDTGDGESVSVLARVRDATDPAIDAPGVVRVARGRGEAIFVAYDLAYAVSRLRQGDPAYADLSLSGMDHFIRPHELFVNQLPARRQWLPQADVQTALLARLIEVLEPQPRFWYYPEASQRSVLVMTSDDDWSTLDQFETLLGGLEKRDATCSFYMVKDTRVTASLMSDWERAGHTFSVHPAVAGDYGAGPPVDAAQPTFAAQMVRANVERHRREFDRPVRTARNHAIRWLGYVDMARVYADLGIRLECNYVSVHPLVIGHLCGTGRPLPFVDTGGSLIDCYQQPTHWTEEALVHPRHPGGAHWQYERAIRETDRLIEGAARTFYTPICLNSHPVSFATYSSPLIEANWDKARAEGMPILSADRWLDWTAARRALRLETRADGWTLHSPCAVPAATVLLPGDSVPSAEGADASSQVLWGRNYLALTCRDLGEGERRSIRQGAAPK
ncbi:MAG TPA: hypothetical protein VH482_25620 [Thermomicrobiales bacterium]